MNEIEKVIDEFNYNILIAGLTKIHGEIVDKLINLGGLDAWQICYAIHSMINLYDYDDDDDYDDDYYASRLEEGYIFELSNGENYDWICDSDKNNDDKIEDDLYQIIEEFYADFLEKNNIEIEDYNYPGYTQQIALQTNSETDKKEEIELLELIKMINN